MRISAGMALRAALGASLALNLVFAALLFWQGPARPRGVRGLEARMRRLHVSPGGAADLLAAALLLDRIDTIRD